MGESGCPKAGAAGRARAYGRMAEGAGQADREAEGDEESRQAGCFWAVGARLLLYGSLCYRGVDCGGCLTRETGREDWPLGMRSLLIC